MRKFGVLIRVMVTWQRNLSKSVQLSVLFEGQLFHGNMYFSPVNFLFLGRSHYFLSVALPRWSCFITDHVTQLSLFFWQNSTLKWKSRFWETSDGAEKSPWKHCLLTRNPSQPCLIVESLSPAHSHPHFKWVQAAQMSSMAVQKTVRVPRTWGQSPGRWGFKMDDLTQVHVRRAWSWPVIFPLVFPRIAEITCSLGTVGLLYQVMVWNVELRFGGKNKINVR